MKKIFQLGLLALGFLGACSDDVEVDKTPTVISLSADKEVVFTNIEDSIVLSVTDEFGKDWTSLCTLYVNDEELVSNVFRTEEVGSYEFTADLDSLELTSNTLLIEAMLAKSVNLLVDKTEALIDGNDKVAIKVYNESGEDITNEVSLYANETLLTDPYYGTTTSGIVTIKAVYEEFEESVDVEFSANAMFTKRVLIDEYTGFWCNKCPEAIEAVDAVVKKDMRLVPVAIHIGAREPMTNRFCQPLADHYNPEGAYPTLILDRQEKWNKPFLSDNLSSSLETSSPLGISISSSISGTNADITIKTRFKDDIQNDLKLVVYLVENKVINKQYGAPGDWENFEHNHVFRDSFTDAFGDAIPNSETSANNIYEKNFNVTIDSQYVSDNCQIVAFVHDAVTDAVINVQHIKLGLQSGY